MSHITQMMIKVSLYRNLTTALDSLRSALDADPDLTSLVPILNELEAMRYTIWD